MSEATDNNLVQRSAQGDQAAFVELIRRYQNSLVALIRRLANDADQAEDLLQDTLLQAWQHIAQVQNPARVQAWLLQVARNCCRDHHKAAVRREQATEAQALEGYVNRYGPAQAAAPVIAEIHEAINSLTDNERAAIELFYLQGFTIKEISARRCEPAGTIKFRLHSARQHLRTYFGVKDEERKDE
jgi:RNA polymerase sigma-70 factor, ECF subfamily